MEFEEAYPVDSYGAQDEDYDTGFVPEDESTEIFVNEPGVFADDDYGTSEYTDSDPLSEIPIAPSFKESDFATAQGAPFDFSAFDSTDADSDAIGVSVDGWIGNGLSAFEGANL